MAKFVLVLLAVVAAASAFCLSSLPYYAAAASLAVGIGSVNSHASCRFTNATGVNIDGDCPPQCYLTLKAAWGDCYCLNPNFLPPGGDPPVANMTVKQLFHFVAVKSVAAPSMQCRAWMNTPSSISMWTCGGSPRREPEAVPRKLRIV